MPQEFLLQEGENILLGVKPLKGLMYMWIVTSTITFGFFSLFIGGFFGIALGGIIGAAIGGPLLGVFGAVLGFLVPVGVSFCLAVVLAKLMYSKRYYWITDNRVVCKSGLIGYKIYSIPLERVSDVIISRSLMEKIFGFGSIHVQSLAGQVTYGNRFGAEGNLEAVPEPEKVQQLIFELIKKKRTREKITM
jgi:uncharacterized membrane protein YdbT with pleckstrin-like domain